MHEDKKKKIVFSEEVDSSINGFALGISFVLVAIFVIWFKVFNNQIAERIIAIVLLVFGIAGTISEIEKVKKNNLKGVGDFALGLILTIPSALGIIKNDIIFLHIILLPIFFVGMYGLLKGVFEIGYSLKLLKRESKSKKIEIMKIIVASTEIIALLVTVLQLISEI